MWENPAARLSLFTPPLVAAFRHTPQLDKSVDVQQKYPRTDLYYPASQRVVSYPVFIATFVSFLPFEADEPLHVAMHVNRYIGARSSAIETQMRELFRKPDAGALSAAA
jgi:hypothetical protein